MTKGGMNLKLAQEMSRFGARDMELCMQCAVCSASCPLSSGANAFPRKIYRYLQLGLEDELLASPEPWLCYYCGECNKDCPRGAEPAETMMAARRWLITRYDWTGLAKRFYLSERWEIGALAALALGVILLFVLFHGPMVTDRIAVNTFAPVVWIEIGDLMMATILSAFLLSNALRMACVIMGGTHVPFWLYVAEAKTFILHFLTQKRWRECGPDRGRWLKHFLLVSGYLTMMTLIIVCIRWFQVDDSSWHFTSLFGYYATGVLLAITVEMFRSRRRRQEAVHRFSQLSDWLFLILLFFTTLTGILMHAVRLAGWPMGTYVMYVVHLAIAVPMLVIEVPFGKWSHLFYRPLAVFLAGVKGRASQASPVAVGDVIAQAGETFLSCLQCGTCTSLCPSAGVLSLSPRWVLRQLALGSGTERSVDQAAGECVTCNACGVNCPRGIEIIDVIRAVRGYHISAGRIPRHQTAPLASLKGNGNPWSGARADRLEWARNMGIPAFEPEFEYGLFTCCTTAYDVSSSGRSRQAGQALARLLQRAGISFGTLGTQESCCGEQARQLGADEVFSALARSNCDLFTGSGVRKILTGSPHCLNAFKKNYPALHGTVAIEHHAVLLERLVDQGLLKPASEMDRIVTFHDPCYLGRHNGIFEAPRRVLQSIPGLKLIEMPNTQESSLCCGGGGTGAWSDDPGDLRLATLRVGEALSTGAEVIATACPYCIRRLDQAAVSLGVHDRIVVRDLAELLLQAVETEPTEVTAENFGATVALEV